MLLVPAPRAVFVLCVFLLAAAPRAGVTCAMRSVVAVVVVFVLLSAPRTGGAAPRAEH
ncbi:hypothetical protein A2U01_0081865, partial [Trifolium medium]|nr:hypothetical protein [Trifolium medium]